MVAANIGWIATRDYEREASPHQEDWMMTFEAELITRTETRDAEALTRPMFFGNAGEPEAGWATRNPDQAMLFLFVNPRDSAMVDELMAA